MPVNFNETTYGPIADSYASKYGIPTDIFRDAIRRTSNFDPMARGGIAGITNSSNNTKVKSFDIGQSFDFAAQYMSQVKADGNEWSSVADNYVSGSSVQSKDDKTLAQNEADQNAAPAVEGDKAFWRYSSDDWKAFFTRSAWGVLFFILGVLLIGATLYTVVTKGGAVVK